MQQYKEQLDSGLLGERQQLEMEGMYRLLNFEYIQLSEERKLLAKELRRTPLYDINPAAKSFVLAQEVSGTFLDKDVWNIRISDEMLNVNDLEFIQGGATVGAIPQGLPAFSIPQIDVSKLISLFPVIVIITIIALTEAMSVAQAIAIKTKQSIDPNQELIGQGLANILGSFSQSFPVAGSFSRTAVNYQSGGVTGISSVVTGVMVLLTLLFLTPLLVHLPQVILAAIITISVLSLINFQKILTIFKTSKQDGLVAIITFVTTLYFAPDLEKGVAFGIVLSLAYYLFHNARPRLVFLSKYRDGTFHDAKLFHLARCENVAVVRFDAPLFFANAENLEHAVIRDLAQHKKISAILIVASGMNDLDTTGVEILQELIATLRQSKRDIYFAGVKSQVYEVMEASGLIDEIGKDHIFNSQKRAVQHIVKKPKRHDDADKCPLVRYVKMHKEDAQYNHNMGSVSGYFHDIIFGKRKL
jgi:MFS superfamily sulfate permease-like transporter